MYTSSSLESSFSGLLQLPSSLLLLLLRLLLLLVLPFWKHKPLLYVAINNGDAQQICLPHWLYALVVADITWTLK